MKTTGKPVIQWGRLRACCVLAGLVAALPGLAPAQPTEPAADPDEPPAAAQAAPEPDEAEVAAQAAPEPEPDEAAAALPVTRFELEIELKDLLDADDPAAAAALGEELLRLAAAEFGEDSTAYADTLLLVAEAHSRNGDIQIAEDQGLSAIEIYRQQDGPFAETLIEPYVALGDVYVAAEDYLNAMPAYEEARNISRRTSGLLNSGQIEILERMSGAAEAMGEITQAQELQQDALTLVERRYEPHSPEVVDAVIRYGEWLRNHNMFTPEQMLYARTERAITEHFGEDSVEVVPLLRARANSFRSQALNHPLGIGALELAMQILEASPDPLAIAEVQRDMGDWEAAFDRDGTDGAEYLNAWNMLAEVENGEQLREDWFGESPTRFVLLAARSQRGFSTDPNAAVGRLIIRFTVLPSGLTTDVEITDADPPGIAEEAFGRQFRASRFRPMIRNGRLVPARRGFSAEFRYDPERYD